MDKRIPLHAKDITGDLQTLSGYVVALRSGTFASNNILGVEATEQPGYYDFTGIEVNVAYQLWAGTTLSTMTMNTTFSSEEGTVLFGVDDANFLDATDFEDNQIIVKKTIEGVEQLIPYDLQDLITDEGIEVDSAGVEYKFVRGTLCQDNSVFSGKAFFGSIFVIPETGLLQGVASAYYVNALTGTETRITISDFIKRADSAKVSTGIYYLQCQLGTPGSGTNGFADGLEGSIYNYKFEQSVIPIFGERTITSFGSGTTVGYGITFIQRYDATHVRIKLSGVADHTAVSFPLSQLEITSLNCDILPLPDGVYDISSTDTTYIEIECNSTSGTGTFVATSGGLYSFDELLYTAGEINPILKGYLVIDTMTDPTTYYGTGKVLLRTYDTSWVLADNILSLGYMVTIKANNI
jgi:hypothetical protein